MSEFETLLAEYVTKDNPKVHGVIAKVVDGKGMSLQSHGCRTFYFQQLINELAFFGY